jgi:xanthine dehydrogenase large subunit
MSGARFQPISDPSAHVPSVGRTIPHDSALGHVTGSAAYIADLPRRSDELVVGFVPSPVASGRLRGLDLAAARRVPGVVDLVTAADLPAAKVWEPIIKDEP